MSHPLAKCLDDEFIRIVEKEEKSFEELMEEVAQATNYKERSIYNFRSGKIALPAELIPYFVKRFDSRALLNCLLTICEEKSPFLVPRQYDIARLSTTALSETLQHYNLLLQVFDDQNITKSELDALRESGRKAKEMITMFEEIAERAYATAR